ncbi:MAG: 2-C-methyl-D-erythritol 2,4-cyclodiphosphate synthase [Dehalococcoidales bacterium]
MRRNLSQALGINIDCVSVKASTSNRLGAIGREEGIAVYAVALIESGNNANIQHSLR